VQGSKVEKRSVTGSKAKPKSRNVTRKPTQSVGKLVQQAKKDGKEVGQEEGSVASETLGSLHQRLVGKWPRQSRISKDRSGSKKSRI
jgi:hypothetical protein